MKADFLYFIVKTETYPLWSWIHSGHISYSKAALLTAVMKDMAREFSKVQEFYFVFK